MPYELGYLLAQLGFAHAHAVGHDAVEDDIRVASSAHEAKVVKGQTCSYFVQMLMQVYAQALDLRVVCNDGVVVYDELEVSVLGEVTFDIVDDIVTFERVGIGGHLHMNARKGPAGTVIVDDKIMYSEHTGIAENAVADIAHRLGARSFAEYGVEGVADKPYSAYNYEYRYRNCGISVELKAGQARNNRGDKYGAGAYDIAAAVGCGRKERAGGYAVAETAVEQHHP